MKTSTNEIIEIDYRIADGEHAHTPIDIVRSREMEKKENKYIQAQILKGHSAKITTVTKNGSLIISGGNDNKIVAWDVDWEYKIVRVIDKHQDEVLWMHAFDNCLISVSKTQIFWFAIRTDEGEILKYQGCLLGSKKRNWCSCETFNERIFLKEKDEPLIREYRIRTRPDLCLEEQSFFNLPAKYVGGNNGFRISIRRDLLVLWKMNEISVRRVDDLNRSLFEAKSRDDYFSFEDLAISADGRYLAYIEFESVKLVCLKGNKTGAEEIVYRNRFFNPKCLNWDHKNHLIVGCYLSFAVFKMSGHRLKKIYDSGYLQSNGIKSIFSDNASIITGGPGIAVTYQQSNDRFYSRHVASTDPVAILSLMEKNNILYIGDTSGRPKWLDTRKIEASIGPLFWDEAVIDRKSWLPHIKATENSIIAGFHTGIRFFELGEDGSIDFSNHSRTIEIENLRTMEFAPRLGNILAANEEGTLSVYTTNGEKLLTTTIIKGKRSRENEVSGIHVYDDKERRLVLTTHYCGKIVIGELKQTSNGFQCYSVLNKGTISRESKHCSIMSSIRIGDLLFVGINRAEKAVQIFRLPTLEPYHRVPYITMNSTASQFRLYDRFLYIACGDGNVYVFDIQDFGGKPLLASNAGSSSYVQALAISTDGRLVFSGHSEGYINIYDRVSMGLTATIHVFDDELIITSPADIDDRSFGREYKYFFNPSNPNPMSDRRIDFRKVNKSELERCIDSFLDRNSPSHKEEIVEYLQNLFGKTEVAHGSYGRRKLSAIINGDLPASSPDRIPFGKPTPGRLEWRKR